MTRKNVPHPGYFKVSGAAVEEGDVTRQAKQALAREKARLRKRAGGKGRLGDQPPPEQRPHRPHAPVLREGPEAAQQVAREAVQAVEEVEQRRGLLRRAIGLVESGVFLARKVLTLPGVVIEHFRSHEQLPA
jgi:hypothetical protein